MQSFGIARRGSKADLGGASTSAGAPGWPATMSSRSARRMPIPDAPWGAIVR
jgi:hypothetical protein